LPVRQIFSSEIIGLDSTFDFELKPWADVGIAARAWLQKHCSGARKLKDGLKVHNRLASANALAVL